MKKKNFIIFFTLLLILFINTGCINGDAEKDEVTNVTSNQNRDAVQNVEKDTKQNDVQIQNQESKKTTLKKIKEEGRMVYYDGNIVVSGKYKVSEPNTLFGGVICFWVDDETGYLVPRDENKWGQGVADTRVPWFCISNHDVAENLLDLDIDKIFSDTSIECIEGNAKIEVSNYVVPKIEGAVSDKAKLEKVISKEPYSVCQ